MAVALAAPPAGTAACALHGPERIWAETSCYADLWIELLAALGHPPQAALGFAVGCAFEGDQFTFLKPPIADLETLFGLRVVELSLWQPLEAHLEEQLRRGRPVLVEVDAFHLPDTRATTWRTGHAKTTIAVTGFDPHRRHLAYVHNTGWHEAQGEDVDGLLRAGPAFAGREDLLAPYAEIVKLGPAPPPDALPNLALARLRLHLRAVPAEDPVALWRRELPRQIALLVERPPAFFHLWAFNLPRQLGAALELLAIHLAWIEAVRPRGLGAACEACLEAAAATKSAQLQFARIAHRRRPVAVDHLLDRIAAARARALAELRRRLG